jgi:hypothetical protein
MHQTVNPGIWKWYLWICEFLGYHNRKHQYTAISSSKLMRIQTWVCIIRKMLIIVYRHLSNFSAIVKALSSRFTYCTRNKFHSDFVVSSLLLYFQQPCFILSYFTESSQGHHLTKRRGVIINKVIFLMKENLLNILRFSMYYV